MIVESTTVKIKMRMKGKMIVKMNLRWLRKNKVCEKEIKMTVKGNLR